jgi:hypothetical protein
MNVIPKTDIAIGGQHCPAGVSVVVSDTVGRSLAAQGLVSIDVSAIKVADEIETADATPVVETAAKRRK